MVDARPSARASCSPRSGRPTTATRALLSFGQDPRWRRFLVSRVQAGPGDTVLDVATGTGAVAIELVAAKGCAVVGVDQSPEMLAEARRRLVLAAATSGSGSSRATRRGAAVRGRGLRRADFTYLLRYVDDPARRCASSPASSGRAAPIASLEFPVPPRRRRARRLGALRRASGCRCAGRVISPGWGEVGRSSAPSIRGF